MQTVFSGWLWALSYNRPGVTRCRGRMYGAGRQTTTCEVAGRYGPPPDHGPWRCIVQRARRSLNAERPRRNVLFWGDDGPVLSQPIEHVSTSRRLAVATQRYVSAAP